MANQTKYQWKKIKWPDNGEEPYASWECWQKSYKERGTFILYPGMWPTQGWSFVHVGNGIGVLPGFIDIEAAKAEMDKRYKRGY